MRRRAGRGEVVEDVAALLFERRDDGKNALDEAAALGAVGAEASFAPEHSRSDCALGGVVGGGNELGVDEGPKEASELVDLEGLRGGSLVAAKRYPAEQTFDTSLELAHSAAEGAASESAVADAMPPAKHERALVEEGATADGAVAAAIDETLEVPEEMGPAELTALSPVVARPAIGDDEAGKILADDLLRHRGRWRR